jgi:signal transduction histidine kinase
LDEVFSLVKDAQLRDILQAFRPRARVLQLLGDELIGSARLAVFELVKNAYDADANVVTVNLNLTPGKQPSITVEDDGEGMTLRTLRKVWLVPGDDFRQKQRKELKRSRKHHRLPLGEKGLGRFAVHKLGNKISMITRAKNDLEYVVEIDWNELISKPFLDEAPVRIKRREPRVFRRNQTGTLIEIKELRSEWPRGEVRRLYRQITSICSPFEDSSGFSAILGAPGRESWIADLPDAREIINRAIWKFTFKLEEGRFDWKYQFKQVPGLKLDPRAVEKTGDRLKLPPISGDDRMTKKVVADEKTTEGIGPIAGEFNVYDRDRDVLKRLSNVQLLTDYLDENGGIRVYRDAIRVYNYGEPGDDWLGLDLRRVNAPTRGISRNIILGAVQLSLQHSTGLVEKTNREGFVDNTSTLELRRIVLGALATLETERQIDKDRIRAITAPPDDPVVSKMEKPIAALRRALDDQGIREKFEPFVAKIEYDYRDMQETLLSAGMSGLNLAVVFHEVERGVRALHQVITEGTHPDAAALQARELMQLLDGFSTLLRRDSQATHSARKLIDAARRYNLLRLRHHRVRLTCPLMDGEKTGFEAKFAFGLVVGAVNNLIDNSIYWMRVRWPEIPPEPTPSPRQLYIGASDDFEAGPALVIADTGPGFEDEPERLVRPFFTRKPNGMGLGLYYANLAMELNGGQLVFPQRDEVDIPEEFDGAVVALIFKAAK